MLNYHYIKHSEIAISHHSYINHNHVETKIEKKQEKRERKKKTVGAHSLYNSEPRVSTGVKKFEKFKLKNFPDPLSTRRVIIH